MYYSTPFFWLTILIRYLDGVQSGFTDNDTAVCHCMDLNSDPYLLGQILWITCCLSDESSFHAKKNKVSTRPNNVF